MRTLTMYLPQFHRVPENDEWWGEGFTEWTAVRAASPLFAGHKQPKEPMNDNYYDLLDKNTMIWQADLMKRYGIDGQCMYHYYFKDGRKILEKPAENLLQWKDIDMPFCFCWANQRWARTWNIDGGNSWAAKFEKGNGQENESSILLEQKYGREEEWKAHYEYLRPFFQDERYIKLNGEPVFLILDTSDIPCIYQMTDYWKRLAFTDGFPGIYCIGANVLHEESGLDGELITGFSVAWGDKLKRNNGAIMLDYEKSWDRIISEPPFEGTKTYFQGITNYDDSPRRGKRGVIVSDFSIDVFKNRMMDLYRKSIFLNNEFVFLNAWNEWGEGMYLEPDKENGYACLEAIRDAKKEVLEEASHNKKYTFQWNTDSREKSTIKSKLAHYQKLTRCLNRWMALREEGRSVCDYLSKYKIQSIVVYGMGMLGIHLLNEVGNSDIEIKYIIDRQTQRRHPMYEVKGPDDDLEPADAVIITPLEDLDQICKNLKNKIDCRFISIEELVNES